MPDDYVPTSSFIVTSSSTDVAWTPPSIVVNDDWWFDTTGTTGTSNMIWTSWNQRYTSASTSVTNTVYRQAVVGARLDAPSPPSQAHHFPDRGTLRMQELETAKSRAEGLLREHLTDRQKHDLAEKGYFDVCAVNFKQGTRRYYRIKRGRAGNVLELDGPNGREVRRYCCHPLEHVPDADTMLAQKMMIEFNEELFLKTANITDIHTGRVQLGQGLQATG